MSKSNQEKETIMQKYYQHGDVLIKRVTKLPEGAKKVKGNVLAEGEVTGHYHALVELGNELARKDKVRGLQMFKGTDGETYIQIDSPVEITHQEHKRIEIPEETYQIDLVREYDYDSLETRRVVD